MRITNSMLVSSFLKNLNSNLSVMNKYQTQLSSSRKITKISDDPIGVMSIISSKSKLNRLEQYNKNISEANSLLTQSETSVSEMNELVVNLYEQAVSAANESKGKDDRKAISEYVEQIKQQIFNLGNTTLGDRYIFGGYNTLEEPFKMNGSDVEFNNVNLINGNAADISELENQKILYEIGKGVKTKVSVNGVDLMGKGDSNIFKIVDDFLLALKSDNSDEINKSVSKLQAKQGDVLSLMSSIGGSIRRLELVEERYGQDELNYDSILSAAEDVDVAKAIMEFKITESVYNSALSIGSKILQPSLLDFMR